MYLIKLQNAAGAVLSDLTGKTFTIGKVTTTGNGGMKWLALQPKAAAGVTKGSGSILLKVQGGKQLVGLTGKTVMVANPTMAGMGGATGKWLALQPVAAAAKGAAVGTGGASAILAAAPASTTTTAATKGAIATKVAATGAATAKTTAAAGTIWSGTGMSLGLGLGLGAMGPALLAGAALTGGYYLYKKRKADVSDEAISGDSIADEVGEALA